jgi:hypothetical protein
MRNVWVCFSMWDTTEFWIDSVELPQQTHDVPAGKLIKIDLEIWDLRNQLKASPKDKSIRKKIDALLKEREAQVAEINRSVRSKSAI